jgi:hypothetical protein
MVEDDRRDVNGIIIVYYTYHNYFIINIRPFIFYAANVFRYNISINLLFAFCRVLAIFYEKINYTAGTCRLELACRLNNLADSPMRPTNVPIITIRLCALIPYTDSHKKKHDYHFKRDS